MKTTGRSVEFHEGRGLTPPEVTELVKIASQLEQENARMRSALREIADSTKWGEDTAIKREIARLQAVAREAL